MPDLANKPTLREEVLVARSDILKTDIKPDLYAAIYSTVI